MVALSGTMVKLVMLRQRPFEKASEPLIDMLNITITFILSILRKRDRYMRYLAVDDGAQLDLLAVPDRVDIFVSM